MFDIACARLGIVTLGLFELSSSDWLADFIEKINMKYICCNSPNLCRILTIKRKGKIPSLKTILLMQSPSAEQIHQSMMAGVSLEYYSGSGSRTRVDYVETDTSKIYTLAITSGVSSEMKLCKITHANLLNAIYGANLQSLNVSAKDTYISYVHLALMWERVLIYKVIISGAMVAFSDFFSGELGEDLKLIKPTLILGIPRLLEKMHETIQEQVEKMTPGRKAIFQKAYNSKLKDYKKSGDIRHSIWDKIVFKQIRTALGGRLRLMITGSAVYDRKMVEFLRIVFSCHILEGYGSSESLITVMCSVPGDFRSGHLGGPLPGVEVKLLKIGGMCVEGYEEAEIGELCVRSPKVFRGYYYGEDSAIDQDGWLHTGDVMALLRANFAFRFIGVKKFMPTLSNGKTISIICLENDYKTSNFVSQIYLDLRGDRIVAIVVPNEEYVMSKWAPEHVKFAELCSNVLLTSAICKDFEIIHAARKLKSYEAIFKLYVEAQPWISDEILSPTLKLRRLVMQQKYSEILDWLGLE